jgi:hypothetical protein
MNMDRNIVNRALFAIGQNPLTDSDIAAGNDIYTVCKDFYLQTFLEALSELEWTGGMKRDRLMKTRLRHLDNGYLFTYDMPYDCARPIALNGNGYFITEGRFICSNEEKAELLYVSNGRILRRAGKISGCGPNDREETEYLSGGWPDTEAAEFITGGGPADAKALETEEPPEPDDEYPEYRPPRYEPKFYEYIEKTLAAKLAMRIAGDAQLQMMILQEAAIVKREAANTTLSVKAARRKSARFWTDELDGGS